MSYYRGGAGPEEENGMGWGGLVPSREEREEERREQRLRATITKQEATIAALVEALEKAELDAKRYQWLRLAALEDDETKLARLNAIDPNPETAEQFDAVVDAAMKEGK